MNVRIVCDEVGVDGRTANGLMLRIDRCSDFFFNDEALMVDRNVHVIEPVQHDTL